MNKLKDKIIKKKIKKKINNEVLVSVLRTLRSSVNDEFKVTVSWNYLKQLLFRHQLILISD